MSPVICVLRMKLLLLMTVTGLLHVCRCHWRSLLPGRPAHVKVVPGNVHVSEVRRGGVVVRPARFPVIATVGMHAKMGPAIWILRRARLVPAQRAASVPIQPDRKPSLGRLVIQNNRVAKCIGKRTLTASGGDAGEGQTAIGGTRYGRELVTGRASGIIESTQISSGLSGLAELYVSD